MKKNRVFLSLLLTFAMLFSMLPFSLPVSAAVGVKTESFNLGAFTFIDGGEYPQCCKGWEVGKGGLTMQTVRKAQRLVVEFTNAPTGEFQFIWSGSGWNQTEHVMANGKILTVILANMNGWANTATDNNGVIRIHHWLPSLDALGLVSARLEWDVEDSGGDPGDTPTTLTNLIVNPNFAQSGLPGWTNFGGAARETGTGRDGSNALVVRPGNSGANMPITSFKPNTTYFFGVWGKTEGTNANGITVGVQHLTPAPSLYLIFNVGDYVYESQFFTTAGTFSADPEVIIWKDPGRDAKLYVDSLFLYEAIFIKTLPAKLNYAVGESLDLTGMVIDVYNKSANAYDRINVTNGNVSVSGFNSTIAGKQTVLITYGGVYTTSVEVTVGSTEEPRCDKCGELIENCTCTVYCDKCGKPIDECKLQYEKPVIGVPKGVNPVPNYEQNFNPNDWNYLGNDWIDHKDKGREWVVSNWGPATGNNIMSRGNFDMLAKYPGDDGSGYVSLKTTAVNNLATLPNASHRVNLNGAEMFSPNWDTQAGSAKLYGYGYFECRMKVADVGFDGNQGVCASFFLQSARNDPLDRPGASNFEIDFEFLTNGTVGGGPRENWVNSNGCKEYGYVATVIHPGNTVEYKKMDFNPSKGFYTYGVLWLPNKVEWYIEGKLVRTATGDFARNGILVAMNNWTGTSTWGGLPPQNNDAVTYYDFFRYYTLEEEKEPVYCDVCGKPEDECICTAIISIPSEVKPAPKYTQEFDRAFNNEGWRMLSNDNRWMVPGDWGFSRMANFSQFNTYPGDSGNGYIGLKSVAVGSDIPNSQNGATIASPNWDFSVNDPNLYGYGYFEFRAKIADVGTPTTPISGVRSMFWIRGSGVDFNNGDNDIRFAFNTTESWINSSNSGNVSLQGSTNVTHSLNFNPSKNFHTYGILWLPDKLEWWIEGECVRQVKGNFTGTGVSIMLEQIVAWGANAPASDTSTIYDYFKFYEFDNSSIPVDKDALSALIATADTYNGSGYTSESWAAFVTALNNAKTILNNASATQIAVNNAVTALQSAINGLIPEGAIMPLNLIENYNFAQTGLPGWINFGGAAREIGAGRNGSNAMVVTPGNAGANMPIMSLLKNNTTYYFAVWGKTEGTNANGITVGVQNLAPASPAQFYLIFDVGDYVYKSEFFTTAATFNAVPEVIIWKAPERDAKLYVDSLYLYEALIISTLPNKLSYNTGENLDLTGMFIDVYNKTTGTYNRIGINNGDVTIAGFDSVTPGQKTVVITYTSGGISLKASFNVVVGAFDDIKNEKLKPLIDEFNALNESDYSKISWKLASKAFDIVMTVFEDDDATIDDVENAAAGLRKALEKLQPSGIGAAPLESPAVPEGVALSYTQNFNRSEWNLNTDWVRSPDDLWQVSNWQAGFSNQALRSNFDMYESLSGFNGSGFMSLKTVGTNNKPAYLLNSGEIASPEWGAQAGDPRLWGYGYYETRMKVADSGDAAASKGVCASFFIQGASGEPAFEVDFEFLTNGTIGDRPRDPWVLSDNYGYVALALHNAGSSYPVVYQKLDFNPSTDFFTYGILWLPDRIEWWVEGVCVRSQTGNFERAGSRIAMNNWTGNVTWGGLTPEEDAITYYDFVKYYSLYTAPEPEEYTVSFDTDGDITDVTVIAGEKVEQPEDPAKYGYTFLGWFLDGELFDFDTEITEDITLVAKWQRIVVPPVNQITVNGAEVKFEIINGVATIAIKEKAIMNQILSGNTIVFDLSSFDAVDIKVPAEWFKDVDKIITIVTAKGTDTVKTKTLWNNSGKDRLITVRKGKIDVTNI